MGAVKDFLPERLMVDPVPRAMKDALSPTAFAIAKTKVTASAEYSHLPCFRVGFEGTREIVCTMTAPLLKYVSSKVKPKDGEDLKTLKASYDFLENASKEQVQDSGCTFFHATLGPRDALLLPAGYFCREDWFGRRCWGSCAVDEYV